MKVKKLIALLLALMMLVSVMAGCGSSPEISSDGSSSSGSSGEVASDDSSGSSAETYSSVVIGSTASHFVGHFDVSGVLSDNFCMPAAYLVFDKLLYNTSEGYDSYIFADWYWDDSIGDFGGTVLQLKDGIYFANGDQMTASDIIYSMKHHAQASRSAGNWAMVGLDRVEYSDDGLTVKIPWNQTYGGWELIYADVCAYDEEWIEANGGDDFDWSDRTLTNGSGPYECIDSNGETMMVFEKRSDWWQESENTGEATVQTITLYYYTDSTSMMVDYENGTIDAVLNISSEDYDYVAADSSLGTATMVSANEIMTIVMDSDNCATLQNDALREAICYAIDKDTVGMLAYGSLYNEASGFLPESNKYYVPGYYYEYDEEYATQLIKENGLEGTTLTWVVTSGTNATIGEAIQGQLSKVGIQVDLQVYDAATCVQMWLEDGSTDLTIDSAQNANTSGFTNNQFINLRSGTDFPALRKTNETWNTLLDAALNSTDTDAQAELYTQVQQYAYENYFLVPICEWYSAYAYGCSGVISEMYLLDLSNPNLRCITTSTVS